MGRTIIREGGIITVLDDALEETPRARSSRRRPSKKEPNEEFIEPTQEETGQNDETREEASSAP